jgi:YggT family protein
MRFWTEMRYSLPEVLILFLSRLIEIYYYLILARVLMSWFVQDRGNRIYQFLYSITEPVLAPIRRIIPSMGLDFSPIVAFLLLQIISRMLLSLIN